MSILFPLLTLYTLTYLALMGYDFAAKEAFEMPAGIMAVYMTLVLAYAADKEIRRWMGKELPARKGVLFVYAWMLFYLVAFTIHSLKPEYALPNDLTKVVLQVLGVFFGSKVSKKIFEGKREAVGSIVSMFRKKEEKTPEEPGMAVPNGPAVVAGNAEEVVLNLIRKNGRAKRDDLLATTGMTRSSLGRLLDDMEQRGLITQVGERKASYYVLAGSNMGQNES